MIRCSLSFHQSKVNALPIFAGGVSDGVYGNPTLFASPPIPQTDFDLLISNYYDTRSAYENGGTAQKGPWQEARDFLMQGLDATAAYVDTVAKGNENTILISGFVPTKGSRSEVPKPQVPSGVQLVRAEEGVLVAECDPQPDTVSYGCIMTVGAPLPPNVIMTKKGQMVFTDQDGTEEGAATQPLNTSLVQGIVDFNTARKKTFANLTPGTIYYFVFFAANATGVSGFTDSKKIMCA